MELGKQFKTGKVIITDETPAVPLEPDETTWASVAGKLLLNYAQEFCLIATSAMRAAPGRQLYALWRGKAWRIPWTKGDGQEAF